MQMSFKNWLFLLILFDLLFSIFLRQWRKSLLTGTTFCQHT
ncbi:NPL4 family [Iris pallida]|uniref:NPL4 family n=1 Tax=Iris pallida TaxID=29817 RepID=A0AAX6FNK8_IRIPA|nr:NPL4 family [Iris pallida]